MKISLKKIFYSVLFACRGIKYAFLHQQNFFLMIIIAIGTIILGWWLALSYYEWLIVILIICLVLSLEIVNTAWEKTLDFLEPNFSAKIKTIKDLIAGAIVISVLGSIAIGAIIFLPKLLNFLK